MGKRFQAEFFIESAWKETHSCNYLQATDIEMETVSGYKSTSWEKGYGDYTMKPDLATLRRIPWLEGTALVLCDVLDHHTHEEVAHSPRAILKKQVKRLEAMGLRAYMASELEFFLFDQSYDSAREAGYRNMKLASGYNEDYHIFQTTKEEEVMRAIRTGLQGRASQWRIRRARLRRDKRKSTSATPMPLIWPTAMRSSRMAARRSPGRRARQSPFSRSGITVPPEAPRTSINPLEPRR